MDTARLKRFAQGARRDLLEQVATRLELVLQPNSPARREYPAAIKQIDEQLATIGKLQLIDKVAYTWFNRFCALRYMDVNRVNRIGVVSPVEDQVQSEILAEAKMGHMDGEMVPAALQVTVANLLGGRATSSDPQGEAYRLLIVAACNYWHTAMPFLFERIADYTELWRENQRGLTFDNLFGPYLRGAQQITITDPYIRMFHHQRNLMELMESLSKVKAIDDEVAVHLITIEDDFKAEQQTENLQKIADACAGVGIRFTWEFDPTSTIHARHIVTDHGWKILLDRGLDVFQRFEMSNAFDLANRMQQHRQCKAFEVTFLRSEKDRARSTR